MDWNDPWLTTCYSFEERQRRKGAKAALEAEKEANEKKAKATTAAAQ